MAKTKDRTLPGTIEVESSLCGRAEVPVRELSAIGVPEQDPRTAYEGRLNTPSAWDGHRAVEFSGHLRTWTVPELAQDVADRVTSALEEGLPDQKRTIRRNEDNGFLDDRFVTDIALGEEVENPFWRWNRNKSDVVRVAVCLDAATNAEMRPEVLASRMAICAGLGAALETCGYEVSIVAATLTARTTRGLHEEARVRVARAHAHQPKNRSFVFATTVKAEDEPFVGSSFAAFADTGIRRMVNCWVRDGNGVNTPLTDSEWRALTGADLFVYVGDGASGGPVIFSRGLPRGAKIGPFGPDAVRLQVHGPKDVPTAIEALKEFFRERDRE